ncbi:Hypothetical predicted protein [Cloeon dipterum]|uniref:DUF4789 domain-containing protein n=1 Tax=Cloeon dipterum TaxID=197152 RepID=A0A8S1BQ36_9INSE|nr:Hypothetical predicted protein [Cloeon dipterum]
MGLKYLLVLSLLLLCTSQGNTGGQKRQGGSIADSLPQQKIPSIRDCVWEEDLCNRARPLYIDPDTNDGPYSVLYLPRGECSTKDAKCAQMNVPNGKKVIVACTGKNSELLRRKSTYAEATCLNGRFVDSAGQRVVNTPIVEDSCTKEQKVGIFGDPTSQ